MDLTKFLGYKPFFDYDTVLDFINFKERLNYLSFYENHYPTNEHYIELILYSSLISFCYVFIVVVINLLLKREKMDKEILSIHFAFGFFCLGWFYNIFIFALITFFLIIIPTKIMYLQNLKLVFKDTLKVFQIYYIILMVMAIILVAIFKHDEIVPARTGMFGYKYSEHKRPVPAYWGITNFSKFIDEWTK